MSGRQVTEAPAGPGSIQRTPSLADVGKLRREGRVNERQQRERRHAPDKLDPTGALRRVGVT